MVKFLRFERISYFVDRSGKIYSQLNSVGAPFRPIVPKKHKGYLRFESSFVHQIVARAYIPNQEGKPQVNHKNGIKDDNRVENLEWATAYENNNHAFATGLNRCKKLTDETVLEIVSVYRNEKKSSAELAKEYGVSERMIMGYVTGKERKHLNIVDDGFRVHPGVRSKMDPEFVRDVVSMYVDDKMTQKEIAEFTQITKGRINNILRRNGPKVS